MNNTTCAFAAAALIMMGVSPVQAQTELDLWTELSGPPESTAIDLVVENFNAANPDIKVRHTSFENTAYETALRTAFAGGNPPDIAEVNAGANAFQYAQSGQLMDLTDFLKPLEENLRPGLESMYTYAGRGYGVLWGMKLGNVLYYNPSMLEEQGVDVAQLQTWEGFMDAAKTFRDAGVDPIAFGNRNRWTGNHYFTHLLRNSMTGEQFEAIGLQTLDPSVESDISWTDPEPTRAWEAYRELAENDYFTPGFLSDDNGVASGLFFAERAPFYSTGSWGIGMAAGAGVSDKIAFTLFPPFADSPEPTSVITNSLLFTIPTTTTDADAAKKFLEYLASEEVAQIYVENAYELSPFSYDSTDWDMAPSLREVGQILDAAQTASPFLDMIEDVQCLEENVNEANVAILTGQLSPAEAGEMHQECVDDLRDDRGWD